MTDPVFGVNSGLENKTALGWYFLSAIVSREVPGHTSRYDSPSKSTSVLVQPVILIRDDADAGKQAVSSGSSPSGSFTPGLVQLPLRSTALQYSKWPSSSEKPILSACAVHGTRVCSEDVLYIGWKS